MIGANSQNDLWLLQISWLFDDFSGGRLHQPSRRKVRVDSPAGGEMTSRDSGGAMRNWRYGRGVKDICAWLFGLRSLYSRGRVKLADFVALSLHRKFPFLAPAGDSFDRLSGGHPVSIHLVSTTQSLRTGYFPVEFR